MCLLWWGWGRALRAALALVASSFICNSARARARGNVVFLSLQLSTIYRLQNQNAVHAACSLAVPLWRRPRASKQEQEGVQHQQGEPIRTQSQSQTSMPPVPLLAVLLRR